LIRADGVGDVAAELHVFLVLEQIEAEVLQLRRQRLDGVAIG